MVFNAIIIELVALAMAIMFYYRRQRILPFLKIASLFNILLWTIIVIYSWRFIKEASLLSPFYDMADFLVTVVVLQAFINLIAHLLERFYPGDGDKHD